MRAPSIHIVIILAFLINTFGPMPLAQAQDFSLPTPGVMVHLSPPVDPPMLKGIKVHPDNPFLFDFILDRGDRELTSNELKDESSKLIKYFLASLTIPEKDLWVNLSPYEKDRIIPNSFGLTEMGRDLLAEDYMLKQITASLIYPEDAVGKKFWKRVYEEASKKYGTTNIPVNTFNKVWIVPEKALVYENAKAGTAYVVESKLKVMLEQDYLSLEKHAGIQSMQAQGKDTNQLGNQIVREIVLPQLSTEINENKSFAKLRQVYNSLILATWYKMKIKDSILAQVYADKNKVAGVNIDDPKEKERIYTRYLQAFKRGVYNYIKEEADPLTQEIIPRKYFSGGLQLNPRQAIKVTADAAMIGDPEQLSKNTVLVEAKVNSFDLKMKTEGGIENNLLPQQVVYDEQQSLDNIKLKPEESQMKARINELMGSLQRSLPVDLSEEAVKERFFGVNSGVADAQVLVEMASLLRIAFPYDEENISPPLQEAIKKNVFFKIGENKQTGESLYISPITKSFRRHLIFKLNKQGLVDYAFEFMIPGDHILKETFNPQKRQEVARDINLRFPNGNYSVKVSSPRELPFAGRNLYGKTWNADTVQMVVYDYKYDGVRLSNITENIKNVWAKELGITTLDLDRKITQGAMECFLAFRSSGYLGKADVHTENLRAGLVYNEKGKLVDIKVQLVGDFEGFVQKSSSKAVLAARLSATFLTPFLVSDPSIGKFLTVALVYNLMDVNDYFTFFMSPLKYQGLYSSQLSALEITKQYLNAAKALAQNLSLKDRFVNSVKLSIGAGTVFAGVSFMKLLSDESGGAFEFKVAKDAAMQGNMQKDQKYGGIDLTPANMNLRTQNAGDAIKFRLDPVMLQNLQNASGFVPEILNIQPMTNLKTFLGLNSSDEKLA